MFILCFTSLMMMAVWLHITAPIAKRHCCTTFRNKGCVMNGSQVYNVYSFLYKLMICAMKKIYMLTLKYGSAAIICFDMLKPDAFFDVVKYVTFSRFLFRIINELLKIK